ncbi:MAG TPA: T9SS type A sorting domain-containing protein, partial [Rhodothermales bacterium]
ALAQNYPNPFNPETRIEFRLARPGHVRLAVYDMQGRLVRTLIDGARPAGGHAETFSGAGLPSGSYVYRLETQDGQVSRTMILAK